MKLEYQFVKENNGICSTEKQLKALISTCDDISFNGKKLYFEERAIDYAISRTLIKDQNEIYFHFKLEYPNDSEVDLLEKLESKIIKLLTDNGFFTHCLWNDISMYYTSKLYPFISSIENKDRSVIYQLMTRICGSKWSSRYLPDKIKNKLDEKKKLNRKIDNNIFYNLDFIDIHTFLFTRYRLNSDINAFLDRIKTNSLSEKELELEIKQYENKSNWERFFEEVSKATSFADEWNALYEYRSIIAHSRRMMKKDYENAYSLAKRIDNVFEEIINSIDDIKISEQEVQTIENISKLLLEYSNHIKNITNPILETMRENAKKWEEILKPFNETKNIIENLNIRTNMYPFEFISNPILDSSNSSFGDETFKK